MSGFFVLSALKYLGPIFFFFVYAKPSLDLHPWGVLGQRGLKVMGLQAARLVGPTCTLTNNPNKVHMCSNILESFSFEQFADFLHLKVPFVFSRNLNELCSC